VSEFPVQVTIKPPATAASAPWLNFQAQDKAELVAQILDAFPTVGNMDDSLSNLVAQAYLEYGAVLTAAIGLQAPAAPQTASIQSPGPAPQWAGPVAPAANVGPPAPQCQHGEKVYRTGTGSKGPWRAWFCPSPKGTPDQCKAVFL
jgi:hypothetical protein